MTTSCLHLPALAADRQSCALNRVTAIDALRGLAALSVVLFHARSILWIGLHQSWRINGMNTGADVLLGYASAPILFCGLGVQMLFVLSGYCIHRRGAQAFATNNNSKLPLSKYL